MRLARHALAVAACIAAIPAITRGQERERPHPPPVRPSTYAPVGASALPFDSVQAGMLVRMIAPGLHRRMGVIESRFDDTLLFRGVTERELVRVPRDRIEWAQASTGRRASPGGMATGAVIGVLAGVALASVVAHTRGRNDPVRGRCPLPIAKLDCAMSPGYLLAGTAIGMTGGLLVASRYPVNRWRDIAIP